MTIKLIEDMDLEELRLHKHRLWKVFHAAPMDAAGWRDARITFRMMMKVRARMIALSSGGKDINHSNSAGGTYNQKVSENDASNMVT